MISSVIADQLLISFFFESDIPGGLLFSIDSLAALFFVAGLPTPTYKLPDYLSVMYAALFPLLIHHNAPSITLPYCSNSQPFQPDAGDDTYTCVYGGGPTCWRKLSCRKDI